MSAVVKSKSNIANNRAATPIGAIKIGPLGCRGALFFRYVAPVYLRRVTSF